MVETTTDMDRGGWCDSRHSSHCRRLCRGSESWEERVKYGFESSVGCTHIAIKNLTLLRLEIADPVITSISSPSGGSGGGSGNSGNNNSFPLFPLDPNFRSACRGTTCGQLFTAQKFVDDTLHLFARGRDGAMWTRVYDGSSWTGSWKSLGGNFQSQPESAVWGLNRKRISVLGVSRDGGKVMTKAYRNGTWESEWLYTNATTNSPITACYIPFRTGNSEYVDTFARSPASSEQGLMTSRLFGEDDPGFKKSPNYPNQYSDKWETHNLGGILGSSIAVACRLMDSLITQDLIMYQRGTRSVAHTQRREPNARLMTWNDRGGSFAGEPVIAASSNSETDPRIDFFGTGQDKKMYHFGWSKSANYTPLESIGGEFQSVPVVLVTTSSRLDVLAVGTDDRLKHRAYINSKWAGEWEDLGVLANSAPYVVGLPSSPYKIGVFVLGKDNDVLFSTWEVSSSPSWKNLAGFVSIQGDLTAAWMESEP